MLMGNVAITTAMNRMFCQVSLLLSHFLWHSPITDLEHADGNSVAGGSPDWEERGRK